MGWGVDYEVQNWGVKISEHRNGWGYDPLVAKARMIPHSPLSVFLATSLKIYFYAKFHLHSCKNKRVMIILV